MAYTRREYSLRSTYFCVNIIHYEIIQIFLCGAFGFCIGVFDFFTRSIKVDGRRILRFFSPARDHETSVFELPDAKRFGLVTYWTRCR